MKQIFRRVIDSKGRIVVLELPEPHLGPDQVIVQNAYSLISSGTELSTLVKTPFELAKQTLSDPWMRQVVKQTILSTGVTQTAGRIWQETIKPREIGYSGAGIVLAAGEQVEGFKRGDLVAYAATGHAEIVAPYINHIVSVPSGVDLRHAAFVTVGGIAIQALRRAEVQFGETIAIYGLGLVGQICAMVAKSTGCIVVGIDVNSKRTEIARANGLDLVINPTQSDLNRCILDLTQKNGVDATIICASSKSDDIVNSSIAITRKQGRVVIVGYVGLNIHPKEFLYKEIDLRYSRAYGPGSYHNSYEKGRVDYPFGYVRWTEKRNLQEFVRILESQRINLDSLIGGTYDLVDVQKVFDDLRSGTFGGIAAVISYESRSNPERLRTLPVVSRKKTTGKIGVSIIGCGNHVLSQHLPNLRTISDVELRGIASATGKNATMIAKKYNAAFITTDVDEVFSDPGTDCVLICSSQNEHYNHLSKAIEYGKAVFVEKPLVTRLDDFRRIFKLMSERSILFTLGLNRRYSTYIDRARYLLDGRVNAVTYTVAVPLVPPDHWTLDEIEGGGRLVSEGEHFIDICNLLVGRPPVSVDALSLGKVPDDIRQLCNFAVTLHYENAVANIVFSESGATGYPRETVTALGAGKIAIVDDFSRLTFHGKKKQTFGRGWQSDMGHKQALEEFIAAFRGKPNALLKWEEASLATSCMFAAQESIRIGEPINLADFQRTLQTDKPVNS